MALGVEGVECEARFPRARRSRHDDELVAWNSQIDIVQIVGAGAVDGDLFGIALCRKCGDRLEISREARFVAPTRGDRILRGSRVEAAQGVWRDALSIESASREGAPAFDVGLRAEDVEPFPVLDFGLALKDYVSELRLDLFEFDGVEFAPIDELKQVASEGHFDNVAELAGLHRADCGGHPARQIGSMHPAEITAPLWIHV